jgi:hypothetical protein
MFKKESIPPAEKKEVLISLDDLKSLWGSFAILENAGISLPGHVDKARLLETKGEELLEYAQKYVEDDDYWERKVPETILVGNNKIDREELRERVKNIANKYPKIKDL